MWLNRRTVAARNEGGSVLLETAFGVALVLGVAVPFASLVGYATSSARDLAAVGAAARAAARAEAATSADPAIAFTCGPAVGLAVDPCAPTLARGTYVAAAKDTLVALPFALSLHTNAREVARVE